MDFHLRIPGGDRRHYIDEADVVVVLSRLPPEAIARLRAVHFTDEAMGNRRLGYTTTRGRREIALCALPPRVSLNAALTGSQTALVFGAVKGTQWPPLAVRRFMLYDVLLHEIGHLQIVDEGATSPRRRFADERRAQELADGWREALWSRHFDHEDPVHNPPSAEETRALAGWGEAHAAYKNDDFARALELYPDHPQALTARAMELVRACAKEGSKRKAHKQAAELLRRALRTDPTSYHANLQLGWMCGHLGHYEDARRHIARALRHKELSAYANSALGDAHADWGFLDEAERLFERALVLEPGRARTLLDHARAIWDLAPHTPNETSRALGLFERALAAAPNDAAAHLYFARALAMIPGEHARALLHAERALALRPDNGDSRELVARLGEPLAAGETAHLQRETLLRRRFDRKTGEVIEDA
ncbi:TPR domain protein [Minicystis rosea]|nr:TPR domain protein [Minicystis rosea]